MPAVVAKFIFSRSRGLPLAPSKLLSAKNVSIEQLQKFIQNRDKHLRWSFLLK